ncbi:MAG: methyltransferase domain-containing protein [Deltaproteobacteria bacterium]|nr:methyltransferase domain-containing protein [Deltaproteobacteria bacterium]
MSPRTSTKYFRHTIAQEYDGHVKSMIHHYEEMQSAILDPIFHSPRRKLKFLDLGMGTGNLSKLILERYSNSQVTGIEVSSDMMDIARRKLRKFGKRIQCVHSDFTQMAFPDCRYDVIASCMSLHHIESPAAKQRYYRQLYHSLRKGGILTFGEPIKGESRFLDRYYWGRMVLFIKQNYRHPQWILKHEREEDFPEKIADHMRWLTKTGFRDSHVVWRRWNYAVIAAYKK